MVLQEEIPWKSWLRVPKSGWQKDSWTGRNRSKNKRTPPCEWQRLAKWFVSDGLLTTTLQSNLHSIVGACFNYGCGFVNVKATRDATQVQHYWFWDILACDIAGRIFDWIYGQDTCGGPLCLWVSVSRAFASDRRCGLRRFHVRGDRGCSRKPSSNHKVSARQKRAEDCRCQQLVIYPGTGVWSRHQRAGWCRGAWVNFLWKKNKNYVVWSCS